MKKEYENEFFKCSWIVYVLDVPQTDWEWISLIEWNCLIVTFDGLEANVSEGLHSQDKKEQKMEYLSLRD